MFSGKKKDPLNGVSQEFADASQQVHLKALELFAAAVDARIKQAPMLIVAANEDYSEFKSAFLKFENDREKKLAHAQFLLALERKDFKLGALYTVAEAWMAADKLKEGESPVDHAHHVRPSERADRVDTFIVTGASKDEGYRFMKLYRITRDLSGYPIGLTPLSMTDVTSGEEKGEITDSCYDIRSAEDREAMPETSDRTFNLWKVLHLARPYLEEGLPFAKVTERLLEDHDIDLQDGRYLP